MTWLLLLGLAAQECPDCYRLAQVKMVSVDAPTSEGYLFLRESDLQVPLNDIEKGDNLVSLFANNDQPLTYTDTVFSIRELVKVLINEHIRQIFSADYEVITFQSWTSLTGRGAPPSLSESEVARLKADPDFLAEAINFEDHQSYYLLPNPELDPRAFDLLLTHNHKTPAYPHPVVKNLELKGYLDEADGRYPRKERLQAEISRYLSQLQSDIDLMLSVPVSDSLAESYVSDYEKVEELNLKFTSIVSSLLEDGSRDSLLNFVEQYFPPSEQVRGLFIRQSLQSLPEGQEIPLVINLLRPGVVFHHIPNEDNRWEAVMDHLGVISFSLYYPN